MLDQNDPTCINTDVLSRPMPPPPPIPMSRLVTTAGVVADPIPVAVRIALDTRDPLPLARGIKCLIACFNYSRLISFC